MGAGLAVDFVELRAQAAEEAETGLRHFLEDMVFGMLGGNLQSARSVVQDKCPEVRLGALVHEAVLREEEVITDSAADIAVPDALCGVYLPVEFHEAGVVAVKVGAALGEQAAAALALVAKVRILPVHAVHVCRRSAHVGNVSCKIRKIVQFPYLLEYGFFAPGRYELSLMRRYGAEITSTETAPVRVHAELYHIVGRNPLPLVTGMRQLCERQVPEGVHLLRGSRGKRRIDLDVTISHRLNYRIRMSHVRMRLNPVEILCKCPLGLLALFE